MSDDTRTSAATTYQPEDSTKHINLSGRMDYDLHRWACQTWGYGPTATARALVLNDTVGEAKAWLDREQNGSDAGADQ